MAAQGGLTKQGNRILHGLALSLFLWVAPLEKVRADQRALPALTVKNDRGGSLRDRIYEIQQIRQTGQKVRVTGRICYSTCTMFLGLPQTCVSPDTVFGFHGPSSYGNALDPDVFERASALIVQHYPEPLRDWYWNTARHSLRGLYRINGQDMIRLGVAACS